MGSSVNYRQREVASPPLMLRPAETVEYHPIRSANTGPKLLTCVDETQVAAHVAAHALAIAPSLGLHVTLAKVMPTANDLLTPADPVQWQMRRQRQTESLNRLVEQTGFTGQTDRVLLAGAPADELARWSHDHGVTLLALARSCDHGSQRLGSTTQKLLDNAGLSLLLVPPGGVETNVRYRRILVPLDGSVLAESILPVAVRIARQHDAEITLAHVTQRSAMPNRMLSDRICELEMEIDRNNGRQARNYLASLRTRVSGDNITVRSIVLGPGDPRKLLTALIGEQEADLVVMSSHGQSGMDDVSCGSVADYLITHTAIPSLVVRPNLVCSFGPAIAEPAKAPTASHA